MRAEKSENDICSHPFHTYTWNSTYIKIKSDIKILLSILFPDLEICKTLKTYTYILFPGSKPKLKVRYLSGEKPHPTPLTVSLAHFLHGLLDARRLWLGLGSAGRRELASESLQFRVVTVHLERREREKKRHEKLQF